MAAGIFGMIITRPFTALALAVPIYLFLLTSKPKWRDLLIVAGGGAVGVGVVLWHNYQLSGDPFTSGYGLYLGPGQGPGFGDRGPGRGYHNLSDGLFYLFLNLRSINTWLFARPLPSLCLFVIPLVKTRLASIETLLLGCALSLGAAHIAYWDFLDELMDPRFLFDIIGVLVFFSAHGYCQLEDMLGTLAARTILRCALIANVTYGW